MITIIKKVMLMTSLHFFLLQPIMSKATDGQGNILKCLSQEQSQIYRAKSTGPIYALNKKLLNYFKGLSKIDIKISYYNEMCSHPHFSPSLALLRLLLLRGKSIFQLPRNDKSSKFSILSHAIDQLEATSPHIFFNFLSKLQGITDRADCLGLKIQHLNFFLERFKYLENEFPTSRLLADKKKIKEMFQSLVKFNDILNFCEKKSKNQGGAKRH